MNVDLLSSYLDDQVTPEQRAYIERHVRTCVSCQLELQSLRQTVTMLHALPRVPVPRAFTLSEARVGRRVRRGSNSWFGGLARVAGVLAAVAVIAVSVAFLRQSAFTPSAQVARAPLQAPAPPAVTSPTAATLAAAADTAAPAAPSLAAPNAAPAAKQASTQPAVTQAARKPPANSAPAGGQGARSVPANPPAAKATQPQSSARSGPGGRQYGGAHRVAGPNRGAADGSVSVAERRAYRHGAFPRRSGCGCRRSAVD